MYMFWDVLDRQLQETGVTEITIWVFVEAKINERD